MPSMMMIMVYDDQKPLAFATSHPVNAQKPLVFATSHPVNAQKLLSFAASDRVNWQKPLVLAKRTLPPAKLKLNTETQQN